MTKKAVQYGAGNIGRGFIGQLFFQSGYETVFIDINRQVVEQLNKDRRYPIEIVSEKGSEEIVVKNVRAIDGLDMEKISCEIAGADIMATAVGVNILPRIAKPLAMGLSRRWASGNMKPLNIIICENLLDADKYLAELVKKELDEPERQLFDTCIGLVEASIGRMVPAMTPEMQKGNILRVCVEEYCELPVDRDAFVGNIPDIVNMVPFSPFKFYIQRKLFIHNLGHAMTAYLGFFENDAYVYEAVRNPYIKLISMRAMHESTAALSQEHGVPLQKIYDHVEDLLYRFGNRALGDTVERVGKDLVRKLSSNDRLVGSLNLSFRHGGKPVFVCLGIAAALLFNIPSDLSSERVQTVISNGGPAAALEVICGLDKRHPGKPWIIEFYHMLKSGMNFAEVLAEAEKMKNGLMK